MDIAKIRKKIKEESEIRKAEKEKEKELKPDLAETESLQEESHAVLPPKEEPSEPKTEDVHEEAIEKLPPHEIFIPEVVKKEEKQEAAPKSVEPEEIIEDIVELLTFHLSNEEFAFRVSDIEEILRAQRITFVPKVSDYILGITSLRGKIIPVINLKKRLLINPPSSTPESSRDKRGMGGLGADESRRKILILKGQKGPIGALIDKVKGVIRISPSDISEPPAHLTEAELMFIEGVVLHNSKFITVVDMGRVSNINLKD